MFLPLNGENGYFLNTSERMKRVERVYIYIYDAREMGKRLKAYVSRSFKLNLNFD